MIVLMTDFGVSDPYVGQVHMRLRTIAPEVPVIDLFHALPSFAVQAAAYLLPAYCRHVPAGAVIMAIVDPGVGTSRQALAFTAGGRRFIGPDNGLFEMIARRDTVASCVALPVPADASPTFHGRDVFAPAAAAWARGTRPTGRDVALTRYPQWPDDGCFIAYIDHYGNAVTGLRAAPEHRAIRIRGHLLKRARTFGERPAGEAFFYENANGLIEIAANGASAADRLGLELADPFVLEA